MKHEAILLDMNGVLVNDEHLHESAFRQVLEQQGQTLSPEEYKDYFAGRTDKEGFEAYLSAKGVTDGLEPLMKAKSAQYQQLAGQGAEGYEGVKEFVEQAALQGLKLAVVTSSIKSEATSLLEGLGIAPFLTATVTAEDISEGKPSPEGYLKAAEQLGVEPSKCLVIEDAPSGIMAAKKAGMECIAVATTHNPDELSNADKVAPRLELKLLTDI